VRDAKTCDYLVEHEQRSVFVATRSQQLEKAVFGRNDPHVGGYGLRDHAGNCAASRLHRPVELFAIVPREDERVGGLCRRDAWGGRDALCREAGARVG
jgi:hypothetical protein